MAGASREVAHRIPATVEATQPPELAPFGYAEDDMGTVYAVYTQADLKEAARRLAEAQHGSSGHVGQEPYVPVGPSVGSEKATGVGENSNSQPEPNSRKEKAVDAGADSDAKRAARRATAIAIGRKAGVMAATATFVYGAVMVNTRAMGDTTPPLEAFKADWTLSHIAEGPAATINAGKFIYNLVRGD